VAAPVKQRPGRSLAFVALVLVGLYLGVFLGPSATPSLGLDLRGGTEVTLTAHPITGTSVSKSALNQAVDIIRQRATGIGANGAEVSTQGCCNIVVRVPGKGHDEVVKQIGQTALLYFRQVMNLASGVPTPATQATPTPSPTGKANGGGKQANHGGSKNKKSTKSQGVALSQALRKQPAAAKPAAKATPSPSVSAAPNATSSVAPTTSATPAPTATPSASSAAGANTTTPLPNSQSATLTQQFVNSFNNWNCLKHPNPTRGADNPNDYIIACDVKAPVKYLLAPAAVKGTQVTSASAGLDQNGINWQVNLNFNGSGSSAWFNVTKQAWETNNGQTSSPGTCSPPKGCNAVAIELDGQVQSAPTIQSDGIPGGSAQITGNFTQSEANDLANVLKYGALPLKFTQSNVQSVSASLGAQQLRGGLIAGIIGLALVILFSLVYYRALGIVTVGSLAVSGLILYAVTTLLGQASIHYTLSLPGIAGFIVAVGITADSFVVFFERIRDEIREGRRLRSAVDRGWPRARRTILSADTVSLLAAVVLYIVSIGDVRGFAFTLGMSTLADLFIVFFFTKPLLQVMAKWKAFDSGKGWTGVGRARAGVSRDALPEPGVRRPRTREA
jgi:preprotein translocase subunit SecD